MGDLLATAYPWVKAFHVMAVISWMAGLFYLPRSVRLSCRTVRRPQASRWIRFGSWNDKLMR